MKKIICKYFGCNTFYEQYVRRNRSNNNKYDVILETKCLRCGKTEKKFLDRLLSRAELLKAGWFFEQ